MARMADTKWIKPSNPKRPYVGTPPPPNSTPLKHSIVHTFKPWLRNIKTSYCLCIVKCSSLRRSMFWQFDDFNIILCFAIFQKKRIVYIEITNTVMLISTPKYFMKKNKRSYHVNCMDVIVWWYITTFLMWKSYIPLKSLKRYSMNTSYRLALPLAMHSFRGGVTN